MRCQKLPIKRSKFQIFLSAYARGLMEASGMSVEPLSQVERAGMD